MDTTLCRYHVHVQNPNQESLAESTSTLVVPPSPRTFVFSRSSLTNLMPLYTRLPDPALDPSINKIHRLTLSISGLFGRVKTCHFNQKTTISFRCGCVRPSQQSYQHCQLVETTKSFSRTNVSTRHFFLEFWSGCAYFYAVVVTLTSFTTSLVL